MNALANTLNTMVALFLLHLPFFLKFISVFWIVQLANRFIFKGKLIIFGILPRHPWGLIGIFCAPFIHADFNHLLKNTLMLLVLGMMVLISGVPIFIVTTTCIILLSGILTWCFGRPYLHVGASSLVMGYWGYLLVEAYARPSVIAVVIVAFCLYYFMGMFNNLVPTDRRVSWEGHLFGFVAGIISVFMQPWLLHWF